ncbi:MAG: C4-dicarboxylate ABC transporter substrate-binding protein, partial [Litorivicinus sp.]
MFKQSKNLITAALLGASIAVAGVASAADYNLRAVANSNENDEDYDGLVVFKDYVEAASNGAIKVDLFIGTQLCANGT